MSWGRGVFIGDTSQLALGWWQPVCRSAWLQKHARRHLVLHMAGCMSRTHVGRHHSSQMSGCMTGVHARRHTSSHMSISMLRLHASRHLVLHMAGCMSSTHAGRHHSSQMSGCMTGAHARRHTSHTWLAACFGCMRGDTSCLVDPPRASTCQAACAAYMHDVRGCPSAHTGRLWLSVCVRVCPSADTGRPWLSISTHISTLAFPVDCSGDFGRRGRSVQYTQDVRGCPSAHTGRPWVSVSTDRTFVAVHVCPCVSVSTDRMSVAVHQYTYQHVVHAGRPWVSASAHRKSVAVCVCPCVSVSTQRTSVAVHQYTYQHVGPWTQHAGPSRGLFGTSVAVHQHTQDVRDCPCVSVCVRLCPSANTGRPWVSISTHISTLVLGLSMLALPVDCLGDCGPRGLSVQYTQDVCGSPPAHTARLCLSVAVRQHTQDVRGCPCVSVGVRQHAQDVRSCLWLSVSTHRTTSVAVHQYTYQHVGPWTQHADLPADCSGDFGPRGLCVQYTQDVRGCLPAHTVLPWLSVCVRVCLSVSVSTQRTSVALHQYTYQHVGPWVHTGRPWVSVSTHISTLVLGLSTLTLPVDCSGDFGPLGLSFQYTQDVCGCPSAHTGRPCVSISTQRTPGAVRVCLCVFVSTNRTSGAIRVCLCVSVSTHRTFVAVHHTHRTAVGVRQHTPDIRGCPYVSVCVRLCPSANTGRPWLSISPHISTLVLGLSMLALPVDCLGDFGPRGLSVQYTHDVRGSPPANTARLCLSVAVRQHTQDVCGCPCVSVAVRQHAQDVHSCLWLSVSTHKTSVCVRKHTQDVCVFPCVPFRTHRTSVAVHQYTYQHAGPWTQHAVPSCGLFGTSVCVRQHTQDIWGCPCVSVCVRVCPSAHTGRTWLSISTHINTLVLGLSTLTLPADCSGDFGPHGLCVQYTQDIRGCLPAHTVLSWLSVCVRVCPSVPIRTHRTSVAVHHTHMTSLGVRQHTQDVRVCPTHINTLVLGLSTLTLPVDCLGYFGPRGLSVHYILDVRGCLPAHTVRPWLSVCVRVCPSVSVSTQRTSVAVHQYTYQHVGPWGEHTGPSRGLFG
ncbi:hypothetical protein YC2023_066248 [Brassica napus]